MNKSSNKGPVYLNNTYRYLPATMTTNEDEKSFLFADTRVAYLTFYFIVCQNMEPA